MAYPPCVVMHRARARSSSREGPGFYPTMFPTQIRCMLPKGILIITDWCFLGYCLDLKLFDGTRGTRFSDNPTNPYSFLYISQRKPRLEYNSSKTQPNNFQHPGGLSSLGSTKNKFRFFPETYTVFLHGKL